MNARPPLPKWSRNVAELRDVQNTLATQIDLRDALNDPDLAFIDRHGVAHPRGFGVAAHFGLSSGLPTIGLAKRILVGEHTGLGTDVGEAAPLIHEARAIGWVLHSKARCKPLVVSAGHRVSQATALHWVRHALRGYRLPEPTRLADRLASRRDKAHH